jgi:hypothetical protein
MGTAPARALCEHRVRRILCGAAAAFALAILALPAGARAASEAVFTVGNYPVEASAENAVAAKDKALSEGQQAAFRSLLKRLVPVTAFTQVRNLSSVKAGDLIEGVRVRAERNSTTDYIATFDFSFSSKGVRDLLRREGIPFVDEQASALTVVPVWRDGGAAPRDEAGWTNVWRGLDLEHTLTPVKLQTLKKEIHPDAISALAAGDGSAVRIFASEYRSELVLLALAEPDPAANRLHVTLSGRDAAGAIVLKRSYRLDASDPAYTREFAAVVALRTLEGRWKAIKAPSAGGGTVSGAGATDFLIAVEFRGMSEWQDISRRLGALPGVEELEVVGLSARGARVTLRYAEGAEQFAAALARQGLALRNTGGNWTISAQ